MTRPEGYYERNAKVAERIASKMIEAFNNRNEKAYTGEDIKKIIWDGVIDGLTQEDCTYMAFLWTQQSMVNGLNLAAGGSGNIV